VERGTGKTERSSVKDLLFNLCSNFSLPYTGWFLRKDFISGGSVPLPKSASSNKNANNFQTVTILGKRDHHYHRIQKPLRLHIIYYTAFKICGNNSCVCSWDWVCLMAQSCWITFSDALHYNGKDGCKYLNAKLNTFFLSASTISTGESITAQGFPRFLSPRELFLKIGNPVY
jgi:hypothetical protein